MAIRIKNSNEILTSLKLLSVLDKENRFYYANEYIKLSDSINIVQKIRITNMRELNMKLLRLKMKIEF